MKGTVGELGEFGLIRELTSRLTTTPAVRLGPGDDAAVVAAPDRRVVASTDILLEGRHFRRDWSTAYDVGRKAAAQNLADIAAMGAVPTALLLGLVVPAELPVTWPAELMDGIRDECQVAGAAVVGGDVVRGDTITVVDHRARRPAQPRAGHPVRRPARRRRRRHRLAGLVRRRARGALARLPLARAPSSRPTAAPSRRTTRAPRRPDSAPPP